MKPQEISDLDFAFPASVKHLMPKWEEIPREFKLFHGSRWNDVFGDFFYSGAKNIQWKPKDGIDANRAFRHIRTIMSSFEPKHEHKEAACAYLMSLWFDDVKYEAVK